MLEVFIQLDDSSIVVLFFTRDELPLWTLIVPRSITSISTAIHFIQLR